MLFLGTCLWKAYGLMLGDWSIMFTNLVCGLLGSVILYLKLVEKPGPRCGSQGRKSVA